MVRLLSSTRLTIALCLFLAAGGIAGSILYQGNTSFGKPDAFNLFHSPLFLVPAGLLVLNILFCAARRLGSLSWRAPRTWTFAGMHLALILLAAGMLLDGLFGFVGTKYLYQGIPESSYLNWRTKRDEVFPFTVEVRKSRIAYYPLNLRIGVKKADGTKVGAFTVREGVPFRVAGGALTVTPRTFDPASKALVFDAHLEGKTHAGLRVGQGEAASVGGYLVVPIAYADPEPSEYYAAVRFAAPGKPPEDREIRINHPATFAGVTFCLVDVSEDAYRNPYVGLQMTREPGQPVFWGGALLFVLCLTGHLFIRRRAPAPEPAPAGVSPRGSSEGGAGGPGDAAAIIVTGLVSIVLLAAVPAEGLAFGKVILGEETWEGEIRVTEPVTVEKGATLRIRPGTRVLLSGEERGGTGCRDGYVQAFGTVIVEGEKDRPVRFLRLHADREWEEIFLKDAEAVIRFAVFEGAKWGLHIHDGHVEVAGSLFKGNGGGARLKGKGVSFSRCTFRDNGVGLRFWEGGPTVLASVIEGNGTGFFYRDGSGGGKIAGSRVGNREWNLKVGDWAAGDLDLSGNYWGTGTEGEFLARIRDYREKKGPGRIVLSPRLSDPPGDCGAEIGGEP